MRAATAFSSLWRPGTARSMTAHLLSAAVNAASIRFPFKSEIGIWMLAVGDSPFKNGGEPGFGFFRLPCRSDLSSFALTLMWSIFLA